MKKNKHCLGCGIKLQNINILNLGYTVNLENDLCMRCFRLKNYGEYESVSSSLVEYEKILGAVSRTRDLVLYVVDLLNVPNNLKDIRNYLKNDIILVLNKRDLLPLSVKDEKIIDYFKQQDLGFKDIIVVSSEKNYNFDLLYKKIIKYQKGSNVYAVGFTNAGKSSLITRFIKNYGGGDDNLTISPLPSTTLNKIIIPINEKITLIDTPGIVDNTNMINFVDKKLYKKLNSKKEIKTRTYQLSKNQCLILDDLVRIEYIEGDRNSLTFYIPNEIKIKRVGIKNHKLHNLSFHEQNVGFYDDVCINGIGFIKIVSKCKLNLYIEKDVQVFTRKNLI